MGSEMSLPLKPNSADGTSGSGPGWADLPVEVQGLVYNTLPIIPLARYESKMPNAHKIFSLIPRSSFFGSIAAFGSLA